MLQNDDDYVCDLKPNYYWVGKFINPKSGGRVVTSSVAMFTVGATATAALLQWGLEYVQYHVASWAIGLLILFIFMMIASKFKLLPFNSLLSELSLWKFVYYVN